jgi:outer membrane receptor protein involved in Fe transport
MGALLIALLIAPSALPQPEMMTGTVTDPQGSTVPGAIVQLEVGGAIVFQTQTATDGRFSFEIESRDAVRLIVTAAGFTRNVVPISSETAPNMTIVLEAASFFEAVQVTSTRSDVPTADPTVTAAVFPASELMTSGQLTIDDVLKMVPGFTLFPSSRVSNPTTQTVMMRGLGGSGVNRSVVLADGVPLNDAFGGWVYWDKVPQAAIDRIEVQRGSGTDLYGADAVGGVVQILTVRPGRPMARAVLEGGNMESGRVSLFGGSRSNGWVYGGGGEWFNTGGYIPVAVEQDPGIAPRGPIDSEIASDHRSGLVTLGYQAANGWRADAAGSVFDEDRLNGTPAVINSTASRSLSLDVAGGVAGGLLSVRGFGGTQDYLQTFSAVNATRTAESLNRVQRVPTEVVGFGGQWVLPLDRHALLVGAETRHIEGTTVETPFTAQGLEQPTTRAGGTQRTGSAFGQVTLNVSDRLTVVGAGQAMQWHTQSANSSYDNTLRSFNPRGSFTYRVNEVVAVRGSAYKGFRAPTLNEFYRGFRVGSTQTNPNEALLPERLRGADGGVLISYGVISARATGYWNLLDDAITNVTLSSTPTLITKQRANADRIRAAGFEFEGDLRLPSSLTVTFASGVVRSRFTGTGSLSGNRVPQVPEYNVAVGARYVNGGWTGSTQLRVTGAQFEDDQNAFVLRRATVVDVYAGRSIVRQLQVFVAAENLFDNEYDVGRTPILTTGLPRAVRAGVQIAVP